MSTQRVSMAAARLPLLACIVALAAHARAQTACTYAKTGYITGVPYHLAVTYLTPGLPDWRIAVPIPPPECANGYVSGEETLVCDFDVQPFVRIVDKGAILAHRSGWTQGYATVNVTVYCVFPGYAPPPPGAPPGLLPKIRNRSKKKTTEATPTTTPSDTTHEESDVSTSSIEITTMSSDESSSSSSSLSSSSIEEVEVPSKNERLLRWKPSHFWLLPQELFARFMKFLHGHPS